MQYDLRINNQNLRKEVLFIVSCFIISLIIHYIFIDIYTQQEIHDQKCI